jgi:LPXTG-motif cell wall-anchored protein
MTRFMLCIAALLCALAAPSAAFAQGAGDEQYQDPFGDEQAQSDPAPTATATPAPAQSAPSAPAPTAAPSVAQAPTQAAPPEQLPRTGADAGAHALAGLVLLAAGLVLRRRADHQR